MIEKSASVKMSCLLLTDSINFFLMGIIPDTDVKKCLRTISEESHQTDEQTRSTLMTMGGQTMPAKMTGY